MAAQDDDKCTRVLTENGFKELEIKIGGIYELILRTRSEVTQLKRVVAENELEQMRNTIRSIHDMINVLHRSTQDLRRENQQYAGRIVHLEQSIETIKQYIR